MKKTTLILSIVTICILGFVLFGSTKRLEKSNDRDAIVEVFKQRNRCVITSCANGKPIVKNGIILNINRQKYADLVSGIKTSNCPTDFRVAWSDYIFAQNEWLRGGGIGEMVELVGDATAANIGGAGHILSKSDERMQKAAEAWHKCLNIAIQYGVR